VCAGKIGDQEALRWEDPRVSLCDMDAFRRWFTCAYGLWNRPECAPAAAVSVAAVHAQSEQERQRAQERRVTVLRRMVQDSQECLSRATDSKKRDRAIVRKHEAEAELDRLNVPEAASKPAPRHSDAVGKWFEQACNAEALELARRLMVGSEADTDLHVLNNVTLSSRGCELDIVVVRGVVTAAGVLAHVILLAECKANCRDVVDGFMKLQQRAAWLCGMRDLYRAQDFACRTYRDGHFTGTHSHADFIFEPRSFDRIRNSRSEDGVFLRTCIFTTPGTVRWLNSGTMHEMLRVHTIDRPPLYAMSDRQWAALFSVVQQRATGTVNDRQRANVMLEKYHTLMRVICPLFTANTVGLSRPRLPVGCDTALWEKHILPRCTPLSALCLRLALHEVRERECDAALINGLGLQEFYVAVRKLQLVSWRELFGMAPLKLCRPG